MPAWLLPALMAGASILGRAGQGASQERQNRNNFEQDRSRLDLQAQQANNQNALTAGQQNESALMNRANLGIAAPSARTKQALLGSLIQNARNTSITPPSGIRMGQVSGGFDLDALLNAAARKAGGTLQSQATQALETGSDVPAFTDAMSRITPVGVNMQYQKPGAFEGILSGGSLLAGLLGALSQANMGRGGGGQEMDSISRAALGLDNFIPQ